MIQKCPSSSKNVSRTIERRAEECTNLKHLPRSKTVFHRTAGWAKEKEWLNAVLSFYSLRTDSTLRTSVYKPTNTIWGMVHKTNIVDEITQLGSFISRCFELKCPHSFALSYASWTD